MKNEEECRLLAVYGTLKEGYGNHRLIEQAGLDKEDFSGYTLEDTYIMTGGGFPFVFRADLEHDERTHVQVELYSFDTIDQIRYIDSLEGHPNWYKREVVNLYDEESATIRPAWMYLQPQESIPNLPCKHPSITTRKSESGHKVSTWSAV